VAFYAYDVTRYLEGEPAAFFNNHARRLKPFAPGDIAGAEQGRTGMLLQALAASDLLPPLAQATAPAGHSTAAAVQHALLPVALSHVSRLANASPPAGAGVWAVSLAPRRIS
jgi:hypothetical protein